MDVQRGNEINLEGLCQVVESVSSENLAGKMPSVD